MVCLNNQCRNFPAALGAYGGSMCTCPKCQDERRSDNSEDLLPCPLCGGKLALFLKDNTLSEFSYEFPCWSGGATCSGCGVGFEVGTFGGGIQTDSIERHIVKILNNRKA